LILLLYAKQEDKNLNVKITMCIAILIIISFCFSETHYKEIDQLKGMSIKGYSVYREISKAKGMIVIFDGFPGGSDDPEGWAETLFKWTKIPKTGYRNGLVTIVIPYNRKLFITDELYKVFQICVKDAIKRFNVENGKFIVGGFSAGGAMAVGFAENLIKDKKQDLIPKAVFAVDPVLDLYELYRAFQRSIETDCKAPNAFIGINESKDLKQLLENELGSPDDSLTKYVQHSPYFMKETDGGNARYLSTIPVRLYHELDPMWSIKERCRSIFDENGVYGCKMIHTLYMAGNKNAEVILTQNRGYRLDGTRHPHSWNIVDDKEFTKWAKQYLN
jgi:hypothetical protein